MVTACDLFAVALISFFLYRYLHVFTFEDHITVQRRCGLLLQTEQLGLSVGLSVFWSVYRNREPCKNGSTDRESVCVVDSGGPKEACIRWGCTLAPPAEYD